MMAAIAARVPQIVSALLTAGATTRFAFVLTLYLLADGRRTYAIAPRVYGHQLELSGVAVLLALVTGAAIGGIIGALLAVAAYPIIERIWLQESLGENVLVEHARLQHEAE